jgi:hypothetical protein
MCFVTPSAIVTFAFSIALIPVLGPFCLILIWLDGKIYRKDNVALNYLIAKKEKICPLIEYVDDTPEETYEDPYEGKSW